MKEFVAFLFGIAIVVVILSDAVFINGCASANTNLFRAEQTLTSTAYGAYIGYTNALWNGSLNVSESESNAVKQARLKLAASVALVENYRVAYETNSAVKPYAQAALDAAIQSGSNLVWTINFVRSH